MDTSWFLAICSTASARRGGGRVAGAELTPVTIATAPFGFESTMKVLLFRGRDQAS